MTFRDWHRGEQNSTTCSLQPSGAGCKGRAFPSASSGRGAHLCDCGGRCGGQGHIPPGQLVGETPRSLLRKESQVFVGFPLLKGRKMTDLIPFCLALLMISMCFMETLRSFCVMRDATST